MRKKMFGKTGDELSVLGFGLMRLPLLDPADQEAIDVDQAVAMVRTAIDAGVNYLDTAYPYHRRGGVHDPGVSEPFLATALAGGYRDRVRIATKLPTWSIEDRPRMDEILDEQLARLGTDHIDYYLAHNLNRGVWPKMRDIGMLDFLEQAKADGRIGHIGFSFHDHYDLFADIVAAYDWEFAQIQYNYLDVDFQAGRRGLELAHGKGMGVIAMEPLRGGFLINNMPEEMQACLRDLRPDWSLADWGLRWLWSQPEIDIVLSGMSTSEQMRENLGIAERFEPLTAAETAELARIRDEFLDRIKINCTGCGYCLPCPVGIGIPTLFGLYNELALVDSPENRARAQAMYDMQVGQVFGGPDTCVSCRQCEPRCPQGIVISERMPEVAGAFCAG